MIGLTTCQFLEIVGKTQPVCGVNKASSFIRLFPAHDCLPSESIGIVNVHGTPAGFPSVEAKSPARAPGCSANIGDLGNG
jgi:hypothetical protein